MILDSKPRASWRGISTAPPSLSLSAKLIMNTKTLSPAAQQSFALRPVATATLSEVIAFDPNGAHRDVQPRNIKPLAVPTGTPAADLLSRAVLALRAAYDAGKVRTPYDPTRPEIAATRRAQTAMLALDIEASLDDLAASIAAAIFKAAGWWGQPLRALSDRAETEIRALVVGTANSLRLLLAKQERFEFEAA